MSYFVIKGIKMNDVKLMGRIAWIKFSKKESSSVCNFNMAVDSKWKNNSNSTNWIPCVAFGKTAEIINEYYDVGDQICVSDSELATRKWVQNGVKKEKLEIHVHRIDPIFGKKRKDKDDEILNENEKGFMSDNTEDEDIPI